MHGGRLKLLFSSIYYAIYISDYSKILFDWQQQNYYFITYNILLSYEYR